MNPIGAVFLAIFVALVVLLIVWLCVYYNWADEAGRDCCFRVIKAPASKSEEGAAETAAVLDANISD